MKQFKPVLISAAVLLVVALAAFIIIKVAPSETADNPGENLPTVPDTPVIKIMDYNAHEVSSIEIIGRDSGWCIDYSPAEVGISAKMRGADPRLRYDEYEMTTLPNFICTLSALEEIGEGEDADFGFDNPQRKIRTSFKDGSTATLLIGDDLPVEEGLYVKREGDATVYAVGALTKERLMQERKEYLSFTLFPTIEKTSELTSVEYTPSGKATVKVSRRSDEDVARDSARMGLPSRYEMTSPVKTLTNSNTIDEALFDKIIAIEGVSVVEELPRDLAKYGLASPSKLKFETNTGVSASILIGGESPNGGTYVMPDGVPMVIETATPIGLDAFDYKDIMLKLLFFYNSTEVKSFEYALASGEKHTFNVELEGHLVRGTFDGKKLEGRNAGNLFQRTIRFAVAGELSDEFKYMTPDVKVTATLNDGSRHTLELYRANERQYVAEVDGKRDNLYVPVAEAEELIEAFDLIENGKEIPNMF
ncbi:MAG: DUF4340 domain-containing protein [Oscillospiraceae bacterium]|nr:DUF4340 domain-containing protein [Oscillospiraceae bacterium]